MIIRQTTTIVFEYPQDYLQEQEWCKTKDDRWVHKGTDTLGAVYENQISYSIGATADRKTENSSEKPNNSTISKMEQVDKDINVRSKDERQKWTKENCKGCKYNEYPYDSGTCFVRVCINGNKYEPKDEPQTDCAWR